MAKRTDPYEIEVGRRIRARRLARRMSQMELAGRLGVTFQQVQKYEKGTNRITAGRLKRIANILDVPILYFFEDAVEEPAAPADNNRELRLVRAYARIDNLDVQQSILDLTEKIATENGSAQKITS